VSYPFPSFDTITFGEARQIKKETDVVMGQFFNALEQGDPDTLIALAMLVLSRAGTPFDTDDLDHMKLSDIEIVVPEPVKDTVDPASPLAVSEGESEPSSNGSPVSVEIELSES
jgi:hypothetical protein